MGKERYAVLPGLITAALLLAAGYASPGQSEEQSKSRLTGEEIKEKIIGNSVSGPTKDGPYTVHFPGYGQVQGVRSSNYKDRGTWRVQDDLMCIRWDNWWGNAERCWDVFLTGNTVTWIRPDGSFSDSAELVEGNPAGL